MSLDMFSDVVSFLAENTYPEEAQLCLAGGEPLMHREILELIRIARKKGFRPDLVTNGWLLTESMAWKLVDSGLRSVVISLDSHLPEIHDNIRGMKGSYDKVMSAIDNLDRSRKKTGLGTGSGIEIGVTATINAENLHTIPGLMRWAEDNDKLDFINFQAITQVFGTEPVENWHEDSRYAPLWPKNKELVKQVFDNLIEKKSAGCKIGNIVSQLKVHREYLLDPGMNIKQSLCGFRQGMIIDAEGRISVCPASQPVMNIKDLIESVGDKPAGNKTTNKIYEKILALEQQKATRCSEPGCHYDINCFFS